MRPKPGSAAGDTVRLTYSDVDLSGKRTANCPAHKRTTQPPARRRQLSRRRGQRDEERRTGAPRAGSLRNPGPPAVAPLPSLCTSCHSHARRRAAFSAHLVRRQFRRPAPARPRTPRSADLTASVLLARPPRPHSRRSAGGRAGRQYAATRSKSLSRSSATFCVAVGASAAPARAAPSRWMARPLGR